MADELTDPSTLPPVAVAGLLIPATLVPRIIYALRETYPSVTEGKGDDAAVRAVLIHWITVTLASFESSAVEAGAEAEVEQLRAARRTQAEQAHAKALTDASTIQEAPTA